MCGAAATVSAAVGPKTLCLLKPLLNPVIGRINVYINVFVILWDKTYYK